MTLKKTPFIALCLGDAEGSRLKALLQRQVASCGAPSGASSGCVVAQTRLNCWSRKSGTALRQAQGERLQRPKYGVLRAALCTLFPGSTAESSL